MNLPIVTALLVLPSMKTNTLVEIIEKNTMLLLCVARNNMLIAILEQRKRRKCIRIAKTVEYAGGKDGLSCSKFHLWTCAWAAAIILSLSWPQHCAIYV